MIDSGFDGGIRYGGTVPDDMIAQRLSADIRWIVVASPIYLKRFGLPGHPNDLRAHRCVRIRAGDDRVFRWDFERGDEQFEVDVPGSLTIDQAQVGLAAVKGGAGLMYVPEPVVEQLVQDGVLQIVLEEWASLGPASTSITPAAVTFRLGSSLSSISYGSCGRSVCDTRPGLPGEIDEFHASARATRAV